jgi:hypothetical protein
MKKQSSRQFVMLLAVFLVLVAIFVLWLNQSNKNKEVTDLKGRVEFNKEQIGTSSNKISKKEAIDKVLNTLYALHMISLDGIPDLDGENFVIMNELQESMDDLKKMQNLTYEINLLSNSDDKLISTSGTVLSVTTMSLVNAYNKWIQYLRGVDINTINAAEFQYQLVDFRTSIHDSYLTLAKSMYLFPMIVVNLSEDGSKNTVDVDLRDYFLKEISRLFDDAFADEDIFYKKTKNKYAITMIVRGYRDFLNNDSKESRQ